jgi:hypothetical protein
MDWARILAYVTGLVDQELLARTEYLAAENRILKAQLKGRLKAKGNRLPFPKTLSFPKIRSGLESRREAESSHHPGRCLQSCTQSPGIP